MIRLRTTTVASAALMLGLLAGAARADLHEDARHGFQFKVPRDFNAIALKPTERTTVAKYQSEQMEVDGRGHGLHSKFQIHFYPNERIPDDLTRDEYIEERWAQYEEKHGYGVVDKEKTVRIERERVPAKYIEVEDPPLGVFVAILDAEDGVFVFEGVCLEARFRKTVRDFEKAARSFERIEKTDTSVREAELEQMDDQEAFLQRQIDKLPPGWDHLRTDRYLFLYNCDEDFIDTMAEQIEAMRDVYEELYPPDEPIEAISIVRVFDDIDDYYGYGGRKGTGGYWSSTHKELVFFDYRPRELTLAVLNHEAFHQYIYYFYGELPPHSWYNEGHGDYFSGAKLSRSFRVRGFGNAEGGIGRQETVKDAVRKAERGQARGATHLKDLMRFHQSEYYTNSDIHYAQGWALVHMLRESKRLEPEWERILPEYLENLLEARHEVAVEVMERAIEQAEKKEKGSSEELSTDPKDWYEEAATVKIHEVQDRAYEKTFGDWTDEEWDEFNAFYWEYVNDL